MRCPICLKHGKQVQFETELELVKHREDEHGEDPRAPRVKADADPVPAPPPSKGEPGYAGGLVIRESGDRRAAQAEGIQKAASGGVDILAEFGAQLEELSEELAGMQTVVAGTLNDYGRAIDKLSAHVDQKDSERNAEGIHFSSEIAALRESIARLAENVNAEASDNTAQIPFIDARLKAQEEQGLGTRIRKLEEKAGVAPDSGVTEELGT